MDPDHFLNILSTVDQENHIFTARLLDCNQPKFFWIFKNVDFTLWSSGKAPALLLSGPTECSINLVSSIIVRLEMDAISGTQDLVLYFFCSTVDGMRSSVTTFIHTLLHQFICCLPPDRRGAVITTFLRVLLDKILSRDQSFFKADCSRGNVLKMIFNESNSELWDALKAALNSEQERKLTIIIDGLYRVENENSEFIRGLRALIEYLIMERPLKSKVLLSSRPQADTKKIHDQLLVIEYDKERKCLATLGGLT